MVLTRKYVRFGQIHFDLWILLRCNISHHVGAHQLVSSKSSVLDCHKNASSYFVFHLIGVVTTYTMYVCLYMVIHGIHIYIYIHMCVCHKYIYICIRYIYIYICVLDIYIYMYYIYICNIYIYIYVLYIYM